MIASLRLQNFQGHLDSLLEFDPFFNCINGPGHQGKSSVSRALNFLFYNQWDSSWVNFSHLYCTLTLILAEGTTLVRKKGEKINEYTINYPNGTIQKYENFGTTIPEEIQKVLKVYFVTLPGGDKLKLNASFQFGDPPLIDLSPASKARLFGKLTGLDTLDTIGRELVSDKRQLQTVSKVKEEELNVTKVKQLEYSKYISIRSRLDTLKEQIQMLGEQLHKVQQLRELKERITSWKTRQSTLQDRQQQIPSVTLDFTKVEQQVQRLARIHTLKDSIEGFKQRLMRNRQQIDGVGMELDSNKQEYVTYIRQVGVCPTCSTSVTDTCVEKILTEL